MNLDIFLRGLVLGASIAAPVGPIGVLCIRRSLAGGFSSGLAAGLGAALADAVYGGVAAFGVTALTDVLTGNGVWLHVIGAAFLSYLGVKTFLAEPAVAGAGAPAERLVAGFFSTFLLTLTNPMTIISFMAIFAGIGVGSGGSGTAPWALISGVFVGSASWWSVLALTVSALRSALEVGAMRLINRISGLIICGFACFSLAHSG